MDLVIQAPYLAPDDVDALVALTGADGVEPLSRAGNDACRLHDVESDRGVAEACAVAGYDFARVDPSQTLARVRAVVMDMDSTLITIECVDEIAEAQGIKAQVAAITERSMRGEIDFADSLRSRVALLAGVHVEALEAIYNDRLRLTPGATAMLDALHAQGTRTLLLSGGFTFFTDRLRARLKLSMALSNTLEVVDARLTGKLTGDMIDAEAKAREVRTAAEAAHVDGGLVIAIGDGANDLPMFAAADVSIAWRAKPVVRARATHAIDHCGLDAVLNLFV
ncbi:MAG: phosphoserine phosphatase SerB [Casimicrobiaceae bacterium]